MLAIRRARDRGQTRLEWLESWHSFSFASYYDPAYVNFGALRVLNEDIVAPAGGFATHSHRDMEIITYPLSGALLHRDSTGQQGELLPGDIQRMSAGSGIAHSEMNGSKLEPVHFLQIWIEPGQRGLDPEYEQKHFTPERRQSGLCLVASPDGRAESLTLHQDALIYAGILNEDDTLEHRFASGRRAYLQVATGSLVLDGHLLRAGDGVRISQQERIALGSPKRAEILLFDMA